MNTPTQPVEEPVRPSEEQSTPAKGSSIRTSICYTKLIKDLIEERMLVGGFKSESAYVAELVRVDAHKGIVAPRLSIRKWGNLLKAA